MNQYGKLIKLGQLKEYSEIRLAKELDGYVEKLDLEVQESQRKSWRECIKYLKNTFKGDSLYDDVYILFEYCIPLSCYRRPDVILLFKNTVLVLEFKRKKVSLEIDKSQLRGYLNELRNYHEKSHEQKLEIIGALVVTEAEEDIYYENGIDIVEGNKLKEYLEKFDKENLIPMKEREVVLWAGSNYMPLVSIIDATTNMFLKGEIPQIKNIDEGSIKGTQDFIMDKINNNENKKRIFFLTGVPGAGKTLVLLNILYNLNNIDKNQFLKALFTSGNGPLISTLSYILSKDKEKLEGEAFIKEIKNIKSSLFDKFKDYPKPEAISYETILFDESQRSWDLNHMQQYKFNVSEPEVLLKLQNKAFNDGGKANLVCSYGEGQSIYLGEESGFGIWSEVLNKKEYMDWEVYCSKDLGRYFKGRNNTFLKEELFIDTSIRGNFIDVNPFVNATLEVDYERSSSELKKIISNGFDIKISREFLKIKDYLGEYANQCSDKFYGLITSSNASLLTLQKTIPNFKKILSQGDNYRIGKWYVDDCCNLEEAAAEFGCQGLELNLPIVVFGRDYIIKDGSWNISQKVLQKAKIDKSYNKVLKYKDKDEIFRNIYRVLLSRGRKGLVLFFPNGCKDLDQTYEFFAKIGVKEL